AGHKLLILLDEGTELIDVTEGFVYDLGSATAGELSWQLNDLDEGKHNLTLIVFDNFNTPSVTEADFIAKRSGKVSIEQMLPYPNPIEKDGHFTFVITEDADITITIYTITGRKIKTIKKPACSAGYNQIYWNGKDGDGDEIANNTYFYKIKAKQLSNHKISEKIGKVIVLR
ncbi:MAG: FlgD immunoglobulin-like domain containing protein, partial [Candidatus Cloacimonadales bacterium]|nr:FlgD immunoglobulin-like domain containing protein [Candidatus Cloacimonadales bacterium]